MKKPSISSSRSSVSSAVSKLQAPLKTTNVVKVGKEENTTLTIRKTTKIPNEKKRSIVPVSVKKPIDFVSQASEANKTSSPVLERIRNSRVVKSFGKLSRDCSTKQASTRVFIFFPSAHLSQIGIHTCTYTTNIQKVDTTFKF